jgi:uncharacterized protein YjbI with pentapeptide repeats/energy-coupling factor transporter ATP-binding protein EcfA2
LILFALFGYLEESIQPLTAPRYIGRLEAGKVATVRSSVGREVFPAMGTFIGGGLVTGGLAAVLIANATVFSDGSRFNAGALGAGLGAILGLFVGLSRSVWHSGGTFHVLERASVPDKLWDPWLDSGHDVQERRPESAVRAADREDPSTEVAATRCFPAERARVRPRVISPETGEAIPLDDKIGQLIQEGRHELVGLVGGPGSGKTTALRHLAAVLPPWTLAHIQFVDDPQSYAEIVALGDRHSNLVISAGSQPLSTPRQVIYSLASWSQDDVIEYLLSAHWDRCASVMTRLKGANERGFLKGIPELWTVVLDQMARDESIVDVRAAIRRELAEWFIEHRHAREASDEFRLAGNGQHGNLVLNLALSALSGEMPNRSKSAEALIRLIRHRPAALVLAADRIKDFAERGQPESAFTHQFPYDLVHEAAMAIAGSPQALQHLSEWLNCREHSAVHPMAASLLHAAAPGWCPGPDTRPRLNGAYLAQAPWPGLDLSRVDLESADFKEANLSSANLKESHASRARFQRANLEGASLDSWVALAADLSGANLRSVCAVGATFRKANLAGARLIEANLWKANFQGANIEDADFTGANLEDARLKGLKLRYARFNFARFGGADMRNCDLERMILTVPDFHDADLRGALFTSSRLQEANFTGANLQGAGLAEIDWPGADLQDADIRRASFHLGSSRSGLVGSPIACEGSRTGFYTDDYDDQDVKSAEEIRKANLRGADLRGANIEGVDFYLVDLRDAKYTRDQAEHFRNCRAILEDRVG